MYELHGCGELFCWGSDLWQNQLQLFSQCIVTSGCPQKLEGLNQLRCQLRITQCVIEIGCLQEKVVSDGVCLLGG